MLCRDDRDRETLSLMKPDRLVKLAETMPKVDGWVALREEVMTVVVRAKFAQNPKLRARLLATGDDVLVFGNGKGDLFWGEDSYTCEGENRLGRILMAVRKELLTCGSSWLSFDQLFAEGEGDGFGAVEDACRAGTTTPFNFGSVLNGDKANCDGDSPYGTSTKGRYREETSDVGSYTPNDWGLYDMHGNVWEWCSDWYGGYTGNATDPTGPASGSYRVYRGGGWVNYALHCRSAFRCRYEAGTATATLGSASFAPQDRADEERSRESEPTGKAAPRDAGCAKRKLPGTEWRRDGGRTAPAAEGSEIKNVF